MIRRFAESLRYSPDAFEQAAQAAVNQLPAEFREKLSNVALRIEEFATPDQLAAVNIQDRWHLTGLYEGVPLTEQSSWATGTLPPVISLFRQPLLLELRQTGVVFEELVRHVVIHEAGHHFGFSDEDMHALEDSVPD
ncbi:metallopeptidase family protein [Erythrobacter insulae]|uniref:Metallopeptidase family protein n=1 Tax=Erythrobacter insulae TaxID=2584124 RepID=A0A547P7C0_9SPHN|nr:metallopeptidase family protein [Erythrobacter insulae]TRD10037.1 metallopeptidase family protein [Erythrobacter insulae]